MRAAHREAPDRAGAGELLELEGRTFLRRVLPGNGRAGGLLLTP